MTQQAQAVLFLDAPKDAEMITQRGETAQARVAVLSSGEADAPVISRTVKVSAEAPVTVTVTLVTLAARLGVYQIS